MAKTKNRARITTSGNAVALLSFTEMYSLRNISPASTAALQKTMSRDIIKTGSTKSFLPIRNALFLRKTKLRRGALSIASRFKIRHCHRHVVACRQQQGASNMIRQSAARGSEGAKESHWQGWSAQVQARKSWREVTSVWHEFHTEHGPTVLCHDCTFAHLSPLLSPGLGLK